MLDQFLVLPEMTIMDTLTKIDKNTKGIVYVVDSDRILLGAITDGDIRRYILKNQSIKGDARDIMNSSLMYLEKGHASRAVSVMRENKITSIPIVDGEKHLLYIEFANGTKRYEREDLSIPVVIMAGGKGTRLRPYTDILPKPLIPIGDQTITEHIMNHFERFGCSDFTMILNYKKEFIKAYFMEGERKRNLSFLEEKEFLGTAGGLRLLKGKMDSVFFMSNCDILIEENYSEILDYHKKQGSIITLVCALKRQVIPYGTITTNKEGAAVGLTERPEFEFLTNTGLYVIEPEFLDEIPENTFIHITDVIQNCIDKNKKVGVYPINEDAWMDMGQLEELEKMRSRMGL